MRYSFFVHRTAPRWRFVIAESGSFPERTTPGQWLTEALPLHERTLADREQVLGPAHPDTLTCRNNLAAAYQLAGRLAEAEALRSQAEPSS